VEEKGRELMRRIYGRDCYDEIRESLL
jgi:hypothetical protein